MAQLQKVSWRTVGYAALGTVIAAASVVAIVNSDGVRPTALTSNTATRWLVDEVRDRVVLVDGLAGHVVAGIQITGTDGGEIAVQGAGGAFLVTPKLGSVQTISTPKLQLGAAQTVAVASEPGTTFKVGDNGLTIMNSATKEASVVIASDDVSRTINIPASDQSHIAADGSMWLFNNVEATHVNVDDTSSRTPLAIRPDDTTTVGAHAVLLDSNRRVVRWVDGADVPLDSAIANASEAVLQVPGDDAPCAWLGAGDTLACIGPHGIDRTVRIDGLNITATDRLAVAGDAAAVIGSDNDVQRIDLAARRLGSEPQATPQQGRELTVIASGQLVWIDDPAGDKAWVIHRFGTNVIRKTDQNIHLVDEQGHLVSHSGSIGGGDDPTGGVDGPPGQEQPGPDNNGKDDPPVANDDSVTARAGVTVTIPVTANDYDPDGNAIAVSTVGEPDGAGHGAVDVLDGTSVTYVPESGYSGADDFSYSIVDQTGLEATATVHIELFPPGSPNRAPITLDDTADTRADRAVTIDVLANDVDPERDDLAILRFDDSDGATITETKGPTNLPAVRYQPPPGKSGILVFSYQAVDPQGGVSRKTEVTVNISGTGAPNRPPTAKPDSMRLRAGVTEPLDVLANDSDPDGDQLTIEDPKGPDGVKVVVRAGQLQITLGAGAPLLSHIVYTLRDGDGGHTTDGQVLVVKIPDDTANRAPVANADTDRVVIGNTVLVQVTANDVDPDNDKLLVVSATTPANGAGTTAVEQNAVRFTPTLTEITEPTPVTFSYTIDDSHGNTATGAVTVTVLAEALPAPPFARDDFADTVVDKPVTIPVLANDSDPSGGQPTLLGTPNCLNGGDAVPTGDGKVTFTPPASGVGTYRCVYSISNSQGRDAKASIIVTVTLPPPGNSDPLLTNLGLQPVELGDTLTFRADQLATDPDGDALVFGSIGRSQSGTVTQDSATVFTYRAPAADASTPAPTGDNIAFVISDKNGGNVSGTVLIKINAPAPAPPAPTPPVTQPLPMSVFVDEPAPIDVLGLLVQQNPGVTLRLVSVTSDVATINVQQTASGAIVTALAPGSPLGTITYTVSNDAASLSNTGKIRVTAVARPVVNPPPRANVDFLTVASGGTGSVNLLANDTGILDPGDAAPSVVLVNPPGPAFGSVRVDNGVLTLTAAPRASGTRRVQYTVDDGSGPSLPATITLTIEACIDSPPAARSEQVFTPYQTPLAIDLTKYVDSGTIRLGSVSGAISDITGTYTPPAGMNGIAVVNFTVENGCGDAVAATLTIDVNHPPVATTISPNVVRGDTRLISADDLATDDEPLTIRSIAGNPPWVSLLDPGAPPAGLDTPVIKVSPPAGVPSGTYSFTATVADPGGLTDVATINVRIANVAPVAVDDVYSTPFSQFTFNPTDNDSDVEPGPLTVVTVVPTSGNAKVLDNTGNVITVAIGHGVSTFEYTIQDAGGLTASATITITSNHAPTFDDVVLTVNPPTFTVTLTPFDPDIGDQGSLTVTCTSTDNLQVQQITPNRNPSSAIEADRVDVHIKVIDQTFEGTDTITCTATDPFGSSAVAHLILTVHD